MRMTVAEIVKNTLAQLDISYPKPDPEEMARFSEMRQILEQG